MATTRRELVLLPAYAPRAPPTGGYQLTFQLLPSCGRTLAVAKIHQREVTAADRGPVRTLDKRSREKQAGAEHKARAGPAASTGRHQLQSNSNRALEDKLLS
jgi:hypothetical protein